MTWMDLIFWSDKYLPSADLIYIFLPSGLIYIYLLIWSIITFRSDLFIIYLPSDLINITFWSDKYLPFKLIYIYNLIWSIYIYLLIWSIYIYLLIWSIITKEGRDYTLYFVLILFSAVLNITMNGNTLYCVPLKCIHFELLFGFHAVPDILHSKGLQFPWFN